MPTAGGRRMPPEWAPHERTWMAWPTAGYALGETPDDTEAAHRAWSEVARTVAGFEPVTVVVDPADISDAAGWLERREVPAFGIGVRLAPLDDAWMRDIGPSFVIEEDGSLAAVDWVFNGWGEQEWAAWDHDARIGAFVAEQAGVPVVASTLVNEGGGIHVDGRGTVLLTETVQLDPRRNPGRTRADVEEELLRTIGATTCIWLPWGLTRDYDEFGTRGHVDVLACFADPGLVLVHWQNDPAHPDHEISVEVEGVLSSATDALGQPLEVVRVPAPKTLEDGDGWVDWSYINHYVCNGGVVACAFEDPQDQVSLSILERAYDGRAVVGVDARPLFDRGGGVHCITQQEPRV